MFKKVVPNKAAIFAALLAIPASLIAQPKLIEVVKKSTPKEIVIPYERYQLPNGLTVVLHEDHSDPLVHVDVTYHVGSAREETSKSGFAHFFEHMMFQGSDNVADEQHFKIITEAGGTLNGTTNRDRTNYFETVPNNQLEKMLWLEADRMGFLLDAVTQKKFEVQRATVKNERGQNYDNRPYGLVGETAAKNLYDYGHPYSWLTIGYIEDLNRVDVNDLKNFFLRWYGPNNAVISVGGDFDKAQTLKWIDKYFGSIPRGPEVSKANFPSPVIAKDRYVNMTDQYAKNQMLNIVMPTVPAYHKDEDAIDCLAQILGGDNSSILYQNLVKSQKATRASASHPTDELAGSLSFSAMPAGKNTLADMEIAVRDALKQFETRGVTDEDIAKFKASREAQAIETLGSVSSKVSTLASGFTFNGTPNYYANAYKKTQTLTKADVMRVYNQYIKGKNMLILNVLTKDKQDGAAGTPNYTVDESKNIFPKVNYSGLVYNKAKDNFNRSIMPPNGANPIVKVPKFVTKSNIAPGNYNMITCLQNEIPIVNIEIAMPGGRLFEQKDLSKTGLSNIYAQMMDEDTKKYSSEEMSNQLEKLGASLSIYPTTDRLIAALECPSKNVTAALALLQERLLNPVFTAENLDRIKNQSLSGLKNTKQSAAAVAGIAYNVLLYGNNSIFGRTTDENTINNISLADVENMHQLMNASNAQITIVGAYAATDVNNVLALVKKLPMTNAKEPIVIEADQSTTKTLGSKTIYIVNIPGAAQTEFRIGNKTGLRYDAIGADYKSNLMNFALGGNFNSRINLNLREDKGWTYGARSGFNASKYTGAYTFSSGVKKSATDSAFVEVMKEINNYAANGVKSEELSFMKNALGQSEARKYETLGQKAGFFSQMAYYNLPGNYTIKQNEILQNITKSEIDQLAKQYLVSDNMVAVLAGDKEVIAPTLQKLGYTIIELNWLGEEVK